MFLGIEIGGTKLQLGLGAGDGSAPVVLERFEVDPRRNADGILERIELTAAKLKEKHEITGIGFGFGGPVDAAKGRTIKSHQIEGWNDFPLAEWSHKVLGLPAAIGNDCDCAGLAEARYGAGRGRRVVFYVTVGSGIGGGFVIDNQIYRGSGTVSAEIGHLRPGLHADLPEETVESLASGWGIAAAAQARISEPIAHQLKLLQSPTRSLKPDDVRQRLIEVEEAAEEYAADLLDRCNGKVESLTAKIVAQAAVEGNEVAREIFAHACQVLGWGIAQMITLLAPQVVVIGGGVPMVGEPLFFAPLRKEVDRYVFPPLVDTYQIVPAQLGESVVVHGALALAADEFRPR